MKAFILSKYGSANNLELKDVERPTPGTGEVLIKVHAASVNDWDWCLVRGKPFYIRLLCGLLAPKVGIPGVDVAGVIEAVGEKVSRFQPGDAVYGDLSESGFGAFAEYVCAPVTALTPKPEQMSFVEAAAIPHAALLAQQSICEAGTISENSRILINGAGGGMGMLAAQIVRSMGATDITGVDHADKFMMMKSVGFRHMVDYTREDFTRQDQQYDLILDAKTNRRIADYLRVLSPNGVYVSVGGETRRLLEIVLFAPAIRKFSNKRVHVLALKPNKGMDEINRLYEAGMIGPVIDGPHDFNDLPAAVQHFGSGKHLGKVVVEVRNGKVV